MQLGLQKVPINALIRASWLDTEMRVTVNHLKAQQYAQEKRYGAKFPPPIVFFDPKTELMWVADGFHRTVAERLNGAKSVEVDLRKGTKIDAVVYGIEANRDQRGLPFTIGDKEKCILTLLKDKVTRHWSQCRIATLVGCADSWVGAVVKRHADEIKRPEKVVNVNGKLVKTRRGKDKDFSSKEKVRERESNQQLSIDMRKSGMSIQDTATALDLSPETVRKYTKDTLDKVKCPHCGGTGWVEQSH